MFCILCDLKCGCFILYIILWCIYVCVSVWIQKQTVSIIIVF